jgi:hypothetical protein
VSCGQSTPENLANFENRIPTDRHEHEVPGKKRSLVNVEFDEFLICDQIHVLTRVGDTNAKRDPVFSQEFHGPQCLLIDIFAPSGISVVLIPFDADSRSDIPKPGKLFDQSFI